MTPEDKVLKVIGNALKSKGNSKYIQCGYTSISDVPAGGSKTTNVKFATEFDNTPIVVASPRSSSPHLRNAGAINESKTSVDISCSNGGGAVANLGAHWIAIDVEAILLNLGGQ